MIDKALGKHGSTKATEVADQIIVARMQGTELLSPLHWSVLPDAASCFSVSLPKIKNSGYVRPKKKKRSQVLQRNLGAGRAGLHGGCCARPRDGLWRGGTAGGVAWRGDAEDKPCIAGIGERGGPARPGGSCGWWEAVVRTTPPAQGPSRGQLALPLALHAGLFKVYVDSCPTVGTVHHHHHHPPPHTPWLVGAWWSMTRLWSSLVPCGTSVPLHWDAGGATTQGVRLPLPTSSLINILPVATEIGFPRFVGQRAFTVGSSLKPGQFAGFAFANLHL